jgi:AcrR family transcriptional regulator
MDALDDRRVDRRTQVADAALDVIAATGMKGLTHRAVDQAADAPAGTTSNYFRTRSALIAAAVDRLEQRDLEVWAADAAAPPAADPDALAERLARYLSIFAGEHADLTRVRLVLSLDQPDAVVAGHARFMAVARQMVEAAGVDDADRRALWLADYCDGVLLHEITARHGTPFDVDAHRRAIRRLLD